MEHVRVEPITVTDASAHFECIALPEARFFEGHFEGDPILPGAAELLVFVLEPSRRAFRELGSLVSATRLKFEAIVRPGERLELHLERTPTEDGTQVRFRLMREATRCASGTLLFRTS